MNSPGVPETYPTRAFLVSATTAPQWVAQADEAQFLTGTPERVGQSLNAVSATGRRALSELRRGDGRSAVDLATWLRPHRAG